MDGLPLMIKSYSEAGNIRQPPLQLPIIARACHRASQVLKIPNFLQSVLDYAVGAHGSEEAEANAKRVVQDSSLAAPPYWW